MRVEFKYTQTLQTIHPLFEINVWFFVIASVRENEEVAILGVKDEYGGILPMPNQATKDGRNFLSTMREAARNEAYRISKQAVRDAAQKQTT
jgi:hypothetical protein